LLAAEQDSVVVEGDQNAADIPHYFDSESPVAISDSFDERLRLTDGWFAATDRWFDRGVTLEEVKPGNKITQELRKLIAPAQAKPGAKAQPAEKKKLKFSFAR
jgi:hypothetical protein